MRLLLTTLSLYLILNLFGQSFQLDPSFSKNGTLLYETATANAQALSVVELVDSSLIVGVVRDNGTESKASILKLDKFGAPVDSFGLNGFLELPFENVVNLKILILGNDYFLVYGTYFENDSSKIFASGLITEGYFNTSFGTNGHSNIYLGPLGSRINSASLDKSGYVYFTGSVFSDTTDLCVIKARLTGDIEPSFGNQGRLKIRIGRFGELFSSYLKSDRILICGHTLDSSIRSFVLRIYNNGTIDSIFGTDGFTYLGNSNQLNWSVADLKFNDIEGGFLISGLVDYDSNQQTLISYLQKIDFDGITDTGFGNNGIAFIQKGDNFDCYITDFGYTNKGQIVLSGYHDTLIDDHHYSKVFIKFLDKNGNDIKGNSDLLLMDTSISFRSNSLYVSPTGSIIGVGNYILKNKSDVFAYRLIENKSVSFGREVLKETISIYPNPVSGEKIISIAGINTLLQSVNVFDLQGKTVYNCDTNESDKFTFYLPSSIRPGVYFVRVITENQEIITKKLLVI